MAKVCLGIPSYDGRIPVETAASIAEASMTLKQEGIPFNMTWGIGSALIDLCRNKIVHRFLTETDADILFFLDADIIASSNDFLQMLQWASKYKVVGATYPVRKDPAKFFIKVRNGQFEMNEDGLMEIEGFGAGFLCIQRDVFDTMKPFAEEFETDDGVVMNAYFDTRIINRRYKGEDISFMIRWIEQCNGKIFLDPYINLKHVGPKEYDYKFLDYLNVKLERG